MRNSRGLGGRFYTAHLSKLNEYLAVLPGAKENNKICVMEKNEILLNSTTNSWRKKDYVQGSDCE